MRTSRGQVNRARRSCMTAASVGRREHRRGRQRIHPEPAPAPAWSTGGRHRGNGRRTGLPAETTSVSSPGGSGAAPSPSVRSSRNRLRRAHRRRCRRDSDRMVARPRPHRLDRPPHRRDRRWRRWRARDRPCPRAVPRQSEQRAFDRADRAHPSLSGRRRGGSDRPRRARGIVATRAAAGDPRRHAPVPVARGNAAVGSTTGSRIGDGGAAIAVGCCCSASTATSPAFRPSSTSSPSWATGSSGTSDHRLPTIRRPWCVWAGTAT